MQDQNKNKIKSTRVASESLTFEYNRQRLFARLPVGFKQRIHYRVKYSTQHECTQYSERDGSTGGFAGWRRFRPEKLFLSRA